MTPLKLTVKREVTLRLFSDYYSRDFRDWAKRFPFLRIFLIFIALASVGFFMHYDILLYIVALGGGVMTIYFAYFFLRYFIAMKLWRRQLIKQIPEEGVFEFWFNEEGIFKALENSAVVTEKETWEDLGFYEELDGLIYLFRKDGELYDIISDQIIGKEVFSDFSKLTKSKLKYRTRLKKPQPKNLQESTLLDEDF